jgi:hypothetical protein
MTNNSNLCSMLFFCDQLFNIALRGICLLASKSTDVHHLNWYLILFGQFINALDLNAYFVILEAFPYNKTSFIICSPRLLSGR